MRFRPNSRSDLRKKKRRRMTLMAERERSWWQQYAPKPRHFLRLRLLCLKLMPKPNAYTSAKRRWPANMEKSRGAKSQQKLEIKNPDVT
jgi:hypothetical protein